MKNLVVVLGGLLLLSGCTSISKLNDALLYGKRYKEPTTGKTAPVRVFYEFGEKIYIYPNSQNLKDMSKDTDAGIAFTSTILKGIGNYSYAPKSLGMPYKPEGESFGEYKVPADRPVLVKMFYVEGNGQRTYSCSPAVFRVTFEENKNYALYMNVDHIHCNYQFYEYKNEKLVKMNNVEKLN